MAFMSGNVVVLTSCTSEWAKASDGDANHTHKPHQSTHNKPHTTQKKRKRLKKTRVGLGSELKDSYLTFAWGTATQSTSVALQVLRLLYSCKNCKLVARLG